VLLGFGGLWSAAAEGSGAGPLRLGLLWAAAQHGSAWIAAAAVASAVQVRLLLLVVVVVLLNFLKELPAVHPLGKSRRRTSRPRTAAAWSG